MAEGPTGQHRQGGWFHDRSELGPDGVGVPGGRQVGFASLVDLRSGDIVFVPKKPLAKLERFKWEITRRIETARRYDALLDSAVPRVFPQLPEGVCPLFFPILVDDKPGTARALQRRGVDALEFWNDSVDSGAEMSEDARFLRTHVLELPIHQDLTPRQIDYLAHQLSGLDVAVAA